MLVASGKACFHPPCLISKGCEASNTAGDVSVFISMRFRLSTLVLICMRFHLYPLSRAFSNRCVFDENAQRFSVDRTPKRIKTVRVFKRKLFSVDRA